jgi:hypothetical protein
MWTPTGQNVSPVPAPNLNRGPAPTAPLGQINLRPCPRRGRSPRIPVPVREIATLNEESRTWMEAGEGSTAVGPAAGRLAESPVAASPSRAAQCLARGIAVAAAVSLRGSVGHLVGWSVVRAPHGRGSRRGRAVCGVPVGVGDSVCGSGPAARGGGIWENGTGDGRRTGESRSRLRHRVVCVPRAAAGGRPGVRGIRGLGTGEVRFLYLGLLLGFSGLHSSGPDGAPPVKIKNRTKTLNFRVSKTAEPWAKK